MPVLDPGAREIHSTFVDDFALYQVGAAAYGKQRTLVVARVVGAAVAAITEAARELASVSLRDFAGNELELAQAIEFGGAAFESFKQFVTHLLNEYGERGTDYSDDLIDGELVMAVAFVDLVGSTEWTARMSAAEHALAISRFENTAARLAVEHGALVAKFLGDAAMIVGRNSATVAAAAAALGVATRDHPDLPDARGAVTWGQVQTPAGDYYGEVVNLAARATKEAAAGSIVVTPDVAATLDSSLWSLGAPQTRSLRGISQDVVLIPASLR